MTRLPATYPQPTEPRDRLIARLVRRLWSMLCWTTATATVILIWAKLSR